MTQGPRGQPGCAERRGLGCVRDVDRPTEEVGLELHEESRRRRSAVGLEDVEPGFIVGLDCFDHVDDLVGDGLECCPGDVRTRRTGAQPRQDPARRAVPVRRTQSRERRHQAHAVGGRDLCGQVGEELSAGNLAGRAQGDGRPVQSRTARQDVALPGVRRSPAGMPGQGRGDPLRRVAKDSDRRHDRGAGAVGHLARPGRRAAVVVQGRVGVGQHGNHGDPRGDAAVLRGAAEAGVGRTDLRQDADRDAEEVQQFLVPPQRPEVEQQGARGVPGFGGELSGQPPHQPRVDGAHRDVRERGAVSRRGVQGVPHLGGREHGIQRQAGARADLRCRVRMLLPQVRAPGSRPGVLPPEHGAERTPARPLPADDRLALVGDRHPHQGRIRSTGQALLGRCERGTPQLVGVLLDHPVGGEPDVDRT